MLKLIIITAVSAISISAFAKSKEIMGVIAVCQCNEGTVDGLKFLGNVSNETPTRREKAARHQAFAKCTERASDSLSAEIANCHYIKVIDEKVGKRIKRRIERIKDDEENNLQNDLLSTL